MRIDWLERKRKERKEEKEKRERRDRCEEQYRSTGSRNDGRWSQWGQRQLIRKQWWWSSVQISPGIGWWLSAARRPGDVHHAHPPHTPRSHAPRRRSPWLACYFAAVSDPAPRLNVARVTEILCRHSTHSSRLLRFRRFSHTTHPAHTHHRSSPIGGGACSARPARSSGERRELEQLTQRKHELRSESLRWSLSVWRKVWFMKRLFGDAQLVSMH